MNELERTDTKLGLARGPRLWRWGACLLLAVSGAGLAYFRPWTAPPREPDLPAPPRQASSAEVRGFCAACHSYPPPESLPRHHWRSEVKRGYDFFLRSNLSIPFPSMESVALYYEERAPEKLRVPDQPPLTETAPLRFEKASHRLPRAGLAPAVSHLNLVHLFDSKKVELLACDMRAGQVLALQPDDWFSRWKVLGEVPHPAHAEVVDLDGDGTKDVLVADLGSFTPSDSRVGRVVWLRGSGQERFTPITLLEGVGRVADVQAADFRGTGKLDLVVAAFGWRNTGEVLFLENRTTDWSRPIFIPKVLDERHGAIHVSIGDMNRDGKPDFVALFSQEHETIVAFINDGQGNFTKQTLWTAPHPAYGFSGIQLADLNDDGRLDVLCTNGDMLDRPFLLKPYHGVQWLENCGTFPFKHHPLATLPGAHRAIAADFDGDRDLDVVAVSFLPPAELFPERAHVDLDSVILLEQTTPGVFKRHSLHKNASHHVTCAAGDVYGDGRMHLVTGSFSLLPQFQGPGVVLWKNLGRPSQKEP